MADAMAFSTHRRIVRNQKSSALAERGGNGGVLLRLVREIQESLSEAVSDGWPAARGWCIVLSARERARCASSLMALRCVGFPQLVGNVDDLMTIMSVTRSSGVLILMFGFRTWDQG